MAMLLNVGYELLVFFRSPQAILQAICITVWSSSHSDINVANSGNTADRFGREEKLESLTMVMNTCNDLGQVSAVTLGTIYIEK